MIVKDIKEENKLMRERERESAIDIFKKCLWIFPTLIQFDTIPHDKESNATILPIHFPNSFIVRKDKQRELLLKKDIKANCK